jgi:hypothetical protein
MATFTDARAIEGRVTAVAAARRMVRAVFRVPICNSFAMLLKK